MKPNLFKAGIRLLPSVVLLLLLPLGCSSPSHVSVSTSWAAPFVLYQGTAYALNGGEPVQPGDKLGEVTFTFSDEQIEQDVEAFMQSTKPEDREKLRSGIYGQGVPVGTAIYAFEDTSPEKAIAVETQKGVYQRAEKVGP